MASAGTTWDTTSSSTSSVTFGISSTTENITIRSERSDELTVPTVSAHRDVGFTDCPGNAFYPQMGLIREDVQRFLAIASGNAVPVFRFWSPVSGSHFYTTEPHGTRHRAQALADRMEL